MKKTLSTLGIAAILGLGMSMTGCEEKTPAQKTADKAAEGAKTAGDAAKTAGDKAKESMPK